MNDWTSSISEPRWRALVELVETWFAGISVDDGIAPERLEAAALRLEHSLPASLRELYLLAGARDDLFCEQNRLLTPEELVIVDERLVFWRENQNVVRWGIPVSALHTDDPPVEMDDVRDPGAKHAHHWVPSNDQLSQFVLQMLLMDLFALSDHGVLAGLTDKVLFVLAAVYPQLELPDWPWPLHPTRFYAGRDSVLVVDADLSMYGASRHADAHDRLVNLLEGYGVRPDAEWTQ